MGIQNTANQCKKASIALSAMSGKDKNNALEHIIQALGENRTAIISSNQNDLDTAFKENLGTSLLKRLKFDNTKIDDACTGIKSLIQLEDPVGKTLSATLLDDGLELFKVSRPIGVIGVIFESRPDALVQIACLCLKSGNAVLLKGGSEAAETNKILARIIHDSGVASGLPDGWLGLLETRSDVGQMLSLDKAVDLIIPRGSNEFVRYIMDHTIIPVLGHADGICHVYIDKTADLQMAVSLSIDSKCQYVSVCNAAETILVHEAVAKDLLPALKKKLDERNVIIFGCAQSLEIIDVEPASKKDWQTEYLDYMVSIRVVPSIDAASAHINEYGSGHTDVIVAKDKNRALYFMDHVNTADAFWNCSSIFPQCLNNMFKGIIFIFS